MSENYLYDMPKYKSWFILIFLEYLWAMCNIFNSIYYHNSSIKCVQFVQSCWSLWVDLFSHYPNRNLYDYFVYKLFLEFCVFDIWVTYWQLLFLKCWRVLTNYMIVSFFDSIDFRNDTMKLACACILPKIEKYNHTWNVFDSNSIVCIACKLLNKMTFDIKLIVLNILIN